MTAIQFLAEWALRSSILVLSGALLLTLLRVKDSSIRLASWTVILFASLALPGLTGILPRLPVTVQRAAAPIPLAATPIPEVVPAAAQPAPVSAKPFDWQRAALAVYGLVALALLLRLCAGLAISLRMLRRSRATGRRMDGIELRESDSLASPVTLGILHPAIVLPSDWREWSGAKLDAVVVHERSHIRRHDPAVQLLSAIHRAVLWHTPASWLLHRRIVRVAEEVSDDAAIAISPDRASYAQVLLDFMQRGVSRPGVPMARYGRQDERIGRILSGATLSRGVTRRSLAAIVILAAPVAYVTAAARPERGPEAHHAAEAVPTPAPVQSESPAPPTYLTALGNVTPSATVTVKPRVDGELLSVNFKEGEPVQAGQLLATIDSSPYRLQLLRAQSQLEEHQAQLAMMQGRSAPQLEAIVRADQADLESAKLRLSYTQVVAPISGIAGLRMMDPGNLVSSSNSPGIVVITQVQPIAVIFTVSEDQLPRILARLKAGASLTAEAWNRDDTKKLATGRVTAVDNLIDTVTGTAKVKAMFDNRNGVLFPNQFVNVRLLLP